MKNYKTFHLYEFVHTGSGAIVDQEAQRIKEILTREYGAKPVFGYPYQFLFPAGDVIPAPYQTKVRRVDENKKD